MHDVHFVGSSMHSAHDTSQISHVPLSLFPYLPGGQLSAQISPFKKKPLTHLSHLSISVVHSEHGDSHFSHLFEMFANPSGQSDMHWPLSKLVPLLHDKQADVDISHVAHLSHSSHSFSRATVPSGQDSELTHFPSFLSKNKSSLHAVQESGDVEHSEQGDLQGMQVLLVSVAYPFGHSALHFPSSKTLPSPHFKHIEMSFGLHSRQCEGQSTHTLLTATVLSGHESMHLLLLRTFDSGQAVQLFVADEHSAQPSAHFTHPWPTSVKPDSHFGLHTLPSNLKPSIQEVQFDKIPSQVEQFDVHFWHLKSIPSIPSGHESSHLLSCKKLLPLQDVHLLSLSSHVLHSGEHFSQFPLAP